MLALALTAALAHTFGHMSQAEVARPEGERGGTEAQAQAEPGQEAGTVEAKAEEAASAAGAKPVEWAADSVSEEVSNKQPLQFLTSTLITNTIHHSGKHFFIFLNVF